MLLLWIIICDVFLLFRFFYGIPFMFKVNFEHICTNVSIVGMHNMYVCVDFEHIFLCWEVFQFLEIPYIEITITYKHGGFIG